MKKRKPTISPNVRVSASAPAHTFVHIETHQLADSTINQIKWVRECRTYETNQLVDNH